VYELGRFNKFQSMLVRFESPRCCAPHPFFLQVIKEELSVLHRSTSILFLGSILLLFLSSCSCFVKDKLPLQHAKGGHIFFLHAVLTYMIQATNAMFCIVMGK